MAAVAERVVVIESGSGWVPGEHGVAAVGHPHEAGGLAQPVHRERHRGPGSVGPVAVHRRDFPEMIATVRGKDR
jgi:hypothetical protein